MAEVHIIGEIIGATGFNKKDLYCLWEFQKGSHWNHIAGLTSGQTQVDAPGQDGTIIWAHPIDVHFSTSTIVGWPKMVFQVWFQDSWGRNDFAGYGLLNIPAASGTFDLEVGCWKPVGGLMEKVSEAFLGGSMQVKDESIIWNGEDRRQLKTIGQGTIHLRVSVLLRHFAKFGVSF